MMSTTLNEYMWRVTVYDHFENVQPILCQVFNDKVEAMKYAASIESRPVSGHVANDKSYSYYKAKIEKWSGD